MAAERGVLMVGGGFTPAELLAAADGGIAKLFPAHAAGPRYLRSVLAVAPDARVVPTGGIALGGRRRVAGGGRLRGRRSGASWPRGPRAPSGLRHCAER